MVNDPVNRRGGGHGVGEDALPIREDQVGGDAQRPALVAFGDEGEEDLRLLVALGEIAQVAQELGRSKSRLAARRSCTRR